jgi:hypothetical protein
LGHQVSADFSGQLLAIQLFVQMAGLLPQSDLEALRPILSAEQHKFIGGDAMRPSPPPMMTIPEALPPIRGLEKSTYL